MNSLQSGAADCPQPRQPLQLQGNFTLVILIRVEAALACEGGAKERGRPVSEQITSITSLSAQLS